MGSVWGQPEHVGLLRANSPPTTCPLQDVSTPSWMTPRICEGGIRRCTREFYSREPTLSEAETDALLEVLHVGIVHARLAAGGGDTARAEAIADAHTYVPRLLKEGKKWGWSIEVLRMLFLSPLVERYPELACLVHPLDPVS